jgi:hypothetical protein
MAYTDGLMIIGSQLGAVEVETAAADLDDFVIPCNATILQVGALVTEDFVVHSGVSPVLSLGKKTAIGGTFVPVVSVTLDSSATSTLKSGDGTKEAQTAIATSADIDNGDVLLAYPGSFPITVKAGEVLTLRAAVDTVSSGGAYIPFAILRIDGVVDGRQTNVWTATVSETAV